MKTKAAERQAVSKQQQVADNNAQELNASPMGGEPTQGLTCIQHLTKQDIHNLLQYEKASGYQFNRMPNDETIERIRANKKMPVVWAGIHNGVEVRVVFRLSPEETAVVDMPFGHFFRIGKTKRPAGPRFMQPRKGVTISRVVTLANLNEVEAYWHRKGVLDGTLKPENCLAQWSDKDVLLIYHASVGGDGNITAHFSDGDMTQQSRVVMPPEYFFNLTMHEEVWPGWTADENEDAASATSQAVA